MKQYVPVCNSQSHLLILEYLKSFPSIWLIFIFLLKVVPSRSKEKVKEKRKVGVIVNLWYMEKFSPSGLEPSIVQFILVKKEFQLW